MEELTQILFRCIGLFGITLFFLIDIVMLESLVSLFNNVNYYMVSSVSVQDPNPAL